MLSTDPDVFNQQCKTYGRIRDLLKVKFRSNIHRLHVSYYSRKAPSNTSTGRHYQRGLFVLRVMKRYEKIEFLGVVEYVFYIKQNLKGKTVWKVCYRRT